MPNAAHSTSLKSDVEKPPVLFMFPGQGAQYVNMGLHLYRGEPVYKAAVDRCATALAPHLGCDLRDFLFPSAADAARAAQSLNNTFYTQPAIFTISYSLATLLQHWGISPGAFIGHSIGEFVAATFSGVMELPDALRLVATRGRLMQSLPGGSMLTVRLAREEVAERLPAGLDIAAINGPRLCVVAGPTEVVAKFNERLSAEGVACRLLHTSHAFHSAMMDPVVEQFMKAVKEVPLAEPRIPLVSTVTGNWIGADELRDPWYWARHMRSPVQFSAAVQVALAEPQQVLVECGPRRTCATLALQHRPKNPGRVLATMPDSGDPEDEYPDILLALGNLWAQGCTIDWRAFHEGEQRRRVSLPTYAFQRKRYWIEPGLAAQPSGSPVAVPVAAARPAVGAEVAQAALGGAAAGAGDGLTTAVVAIVEELLGSKLESFDEDARFIELGLDSLLLTQMARAVRVRMGFEATFRDLTERYASPRLLVDAIRKRAAAAAPVVVAAAAVAAAAVAAAPPATTAAAVAAPPVAAAPPAPTTAAPASAAPAPRPAAVSAEVRAVPSGPPAGARLGRDASGRPAWFVPDPSRPGKYIQVPTS